MYMWLSFCGDNDDHRGVCIVEGSDIITAAKVAHDRGINPGGEVMGVPMDEVDVARMGMQTNRLYTEKELQIAGGVCRIETGE